MPAEKTGHEARPNPKGATFNQSYTPLLGNVRKSLLVNGLKRDSFCGLGLMSLI
jgi:hypothetical protein